MHMCCFFLFPVGAPCHVASRGARDIPESSVASMVVWLGVVDFLEIWAGLSWPVGFPTVRIWMWVKMKPQIAVHVSSYQGSIWGTYF